MLPLLALLGCVRTHDADTGGPVDSTVDTASSDSADTVETGESADDTAPDSGKDSETGCGSPPSWYLDEDGDGYGVGQAVVACAPPPGTAGQAGDCDDAHATVYPGATELFTSGRDDDCDGVGASSQPDEVRSAIYHTAVSDDLGVDVDTPGDLDGDLIPDLVVMSQWYGDQQGAALVYAGPRGPTDGVLTDEPYASALYGARYDRLVRFSAAGDVDGDGYTDSLIGGGQIGSPDTPDAGVFYLLRGPVPAGDVDLVSRAQAFHALRDYQYLDRCAGPYDGNRDGLDDVVLSAPSNSGRDEAYGDVYILHGPVEQDSIADADTTLHGNAHEKVGVALEVAGDMDGDGRADLGVGTYPDGSDVLVYLVTSTPDGIYHPSDLGVTLDITGWSLGVVINPLGDVNEDGYDDIAIGGNQTGTLPVLFGPLSDAAPIDVWASADLNLLSYNSGASDTDLAYAAPLGDWDGDGHADIVAANTLYAPPETRSDCEWYSCLAGAAFLLAGPLHAGTVDLEESADRLDSPGSLWTFGEHLAAGTDLDQDGAPDLALSDQGSSRAYLYFGGGAI